MNAKVTSLYPRKLKATDCPLCAEKAAPPHTPFCSRRCSQLDLGNWLNEAYVVPPHEADEDVDLETLTTQADKDIKLS
ncbi:DNA gyrase inhibitor YacG [Alphaproteobacteria bacterium]|nr:DNA gyrase inhibitor YacG [Alphaproteobacteria bacterium]